MSETFMEQLLDGRAFLDEVDDWVDEWHDGDSGDRLSAFLGMTEEEYALWVEKPSALRLIAAARERNERVEDLLEHFDELTVAARGADPREVEAIRRWLRETGRLTG